MRIVSIGEILWDVLDTGEHLGGAPFNFAVQARRLGHDVAFVSAVGDDDRGRRALAEIETLGLSAAYVRRVPQPTGIVTVQFDSSGEPQYTIHRSAAYDFLDPDPAQFSAFHPDWIYFGTLLQMDRHARAVTREVLKSVPDARRFYDVNLRPNSYTLGLVDDLMHQADAVKLNQQEMTELAPQYSTIEQFCRDAAREHDWRAVCVTRGERGCALLVGDDYAEVEGYRVKVIDPVGAGDAFAAAFLHGLGEKWPAARIGDFANRIGAAAVARRGAL